MRPLVSLAVAAVVCAFAPLAVAATPDAKPDAKIEEIKFTDADKLTSSNLSGVGFVVSGGLRPVRILLTRPRLTFVPELLVSIQNL